MLFIDAPDQLVSSLLIVVLFTHGEKSSPISSPCALQQSIPSVSAVEGQGAVCNSAVTVWLLIH